MVYLARETQYSLAKNGRLLDMVYITYVEVRESGIIHIIGAILIRFLLRRGRFVVVFSSCVAHTQLLDSVSIPVQTKP